MNIELLIKNAIETRAAEIIDEECKKSVDVIVERLRGSVGEITARVVSHFSYELTGTRVVIEVKLPVKEEDAK